MMSRKALVAILALMFLVMAALPVISQDEGETVEEFEVEGTGFPVKFQAHEIPDFTVVSHFFRRVSMVRDNEYVYNQLLTDIGVIPGSHEVEFLDGVTDEAIEVLNARTIDGNLTGDAYMEHQYKALREKARKLGVVYRTLLSGFKEAGIEIDRIRAYCEETIRPTISVFSTELDNSRYLETLTEFDKQILDM